MQTTIYSNLVDQATAIMKNSNDPVHDLAHVRRVVSYTEKLCNDMHITGDQRQALLLASWWHDASRTITKKPSVVWMPLIDDTLSAGMLWFTTLRAGKFGAGTGMACRIILCKSFGTGALFSRLFIRKKNRVLIDILSDADTLDVLHQERLGHLMEMVEHSKVYRQGYKVIVSWVLKTSQLQMKTHAAKEYLVDIFKRFVAFLEEATIYAWHVAQFGEAWTKKSLTQAKRLLRELTQLATTVA